jgi:hypothetical protein
MPVRAWRWLRLVALPLLLAVAGCGPGVVSSEAAGPMSTTPGPGWTPVAGDETQLVFINTNTAYRSNALVSFGGLVNFTAPRGIPEVPVYSTIVRQQADCLARRIRVLSVTSYGRRGGVGEAVDILASNTPDWEDPPPGSIAARLVVVACNRI